MAEGHHADPLFIAKLLTNRLSPEDAAPHVAPHLLATCPECRAAWEEVQRIKSEVGHWDEWVAVRESATAPGLLAELDLLAHGERVRAVEREGRFRSWVLCRQLVQRGKDGALTDPQLGVDWASLAVRVATHLSSEYGESAVAGLHAEALATLANAYRVAGELRVAEECFLSAEQLLAVPGAASPMLLADIRSLEASLRLAQRRLPEARELVRFSLAVATVRGDRHRMGKLLLKEAKIVEEAGDLPAAAAKLRQAAEEIDGGTDAELYRIARFNLLAVLAQEGPYPEAEALLPQVEALFADEPEDSLYRLRLRWAEGLIARGQHRPEAAENALLAVQRELVRRQMGYDAALVAIDLGLVYLETGAEKPLQSLAAGLPPILTAKELSKEAFASLLVYQDACRSAKLTERLARQLALFMNEDRRRPPALKVAFQPGDVTEPAETAEPSIAVASVAGGV